MSYHFMARGPGDEPWGVSCKLCGMPIGASDRTEEVRFPEGSESADMTGTYHFECSKPFASIARAMNMLRRFPF